MKKDFEVQLHEKLECWLLDSDEFETWLKNRKELSFTEIRSEEMEVLEIPASVELLTSCVTADCPKLKSIRLFSCEKIEYTDWAVFDGCPELQEFIVPDDDERWRTADGAVYTKDGVLLMCPQGKSGRFVVEDETKIIGRFAFGGCSKLEEIVLPESLEGIYPQAFVDCTGLRRIVLPKSLKYINGGCFIGCDERLFNRKDGCRYLPSARNDFFVWVGLDDDAVSAKVSDDLEFVADFPETPLNSPFVSEKLKEIVLPTGEKGEMCRKYLWEETMKLVKTHA